MEVYLCVMFFYLSKILAFLLNPLVWVVLLVIFAYRSKLDARKRKFIIAAFSLLYICSNSFIADELMRGLEYRGPDLKKEEHFKYAVVLGGMINYDERLDKPRFERASDRLWQTLVLMKTGQVERIIITGGSGSILKPEQKEANILRKYLNRIGIADSLIIIESESKNTKENAVFTKTILDSLKVDTKVLLVTSAFHMKRAIGCFKKAGVTNFRPYPTDRFSGPRKFQFDHCLIPQPESLFITALFFHEVAGYVMYWMLGYL